MNAKTALFLLTLCSSVTASVPLTVPYQGRLTDNTGTPLDGVYELTFRLFSVPTAGAVLWDETQSVSVSEGIFHAELGSIEPIPDSVFITADLYLGISVEADAELVPRIKLGSVAYARRVGTVDGAAGGTVSGNLHVTGAVTSAQQSKWLAIPPSAFIPIVNAATMTFDGQSWFNSGAFQSVNLLAPVMLPHGAVVDSIIVTVTDSSSDFNVNANLVYHNLGLFYISGGTSSTSGTPGLTNLVLPEMDWQVSQDVYGYSVQVSWLTPATQSSGMRVGMVRVHYRL